MNSETNFVTWMMRVLAIGLIVGAVSGCVPMQPKPEKVGFVIQVSDNDAAKWNLALNNAKNVQSDIGKDKSEIEIVAYGPGINMLKDDSVVGNRLDEAKAAGIKIYACGNTMKGMKLTKEDLHPSAEVVKAGVLEIGDKQQKGWVYVRP